MLFGLEVNCAKGYTTENRSDGTVIPGHSSPSANFVVTLKRRARAPHQVGLPTFWLWPFMA